MHKTLKKILLSTSFATASMLSLTSATWSMGHGMGMGYDPDRMLSHMTAELELSEQQQEEVRALLTGAQQDTASDRQRLRELRKELRQQGAEFDEGRVQSIAEEIGQITTRLVYRVASTQSQVQAQLTPEQQEELRRLVEKRDQRRGKWKRGHGGSHEE